MVSWSYCIGIIFGAIITLESINSRIITYFIMQGMSLEQAKEERNKLISLKYKWYHLFDRRD